MKALSGVASLACVAILRRSLSAHFSPHGELAGFGHQQTQKRLCRTLRQPKFSVNGESANIRSVAPQQRRGCCLECEPLSKSERPVESDKASRLGFVDDSKVPTKTIESTAAPLQRLCMRLQHRTRRLGFVSLQNNVPNWCSCTPQARSAKCLHIAQRSALAVAAKRRGEVACLSTSGLLTC